jgi:hypothetical protein
LAVEDDKLLPEENILVDEIGFAARELGGVENSRMAGRLGAFELC